MSAPKVAVVNLGCRVNRVESDTIAQSYAANGSSLVEPAEADLIIVNTCTVTGEAEKKTRKTVRRALRVNPNARVLVTGCAAVIDPACYEAMSPRISVVDKVDLLDADPIIRVGSGFPARVGVKIQDGCNHACTYCIVHVARGRAWSVPHESILAEVQALAAEGVGEIVLTGIDLGSYKDGTMGLAGLLRELLDATEGVRFRISSIEPCSVKQDLVDVMATSDGRICQHLHLPLQSGSSKVLAEMHRPYDAAFFLGLVARLRAAMPTISLSTDLIVGFPGETEQDFAESCRMIREARFSKVHLFRYSKRQGTPAAARTDQIDPQVKEDRFKRMEALADEVRRSFARELVGTREVVAVEGDGWGTTERFFKAKVDPAFPAGSLVTVSLTDCDGSGIFSTC